MSAAATDDGTSGPPRGAPTFLGHPDLQKDYGFRAIKVTTDTSKLIIEELMGKKPRYSYFNGCSCGGREALMEAQRDPNDFDGIIVGSPANDLVGLLGASYLWDMQALLTGPRTDGVPDAYIPASKLGLLSSAALVQCAGKDGGVSTDAFLNDPRKCHFDPAVATCKSGQDPDTCLTKAQVEAARKIYWGPHHSRGQLIFPGYEPGSESNPANWRNWLVVTSSSSPGGQNSLTMGFWCDQVFGKANCSYLSINIDKEFEKAAKTIAPIVNSTNPVWFSLLGDSMPSFHNGAVEIAYLDEGEGDPIILVHGFASNKNVNWVYPAWVSELRKDGRRVIALDNRGHGESSKFYDAEEYHIGTMAGDVRALMDHLNVDRADIMGYSLGARMMAYLAQSQAPRVRSAIFGGLGIRLIKDGAPVENVVKALEASSLDDVTDPVGRTLGEFADQTGSDRRALVACLRGSRRLMTREEAASISVPVLIAVGASDEIAGSADALGKIIPGSQVLDIPNRDHMRAVGDKVYKAGVLEFLSHRT